VNFAAKTGSCPAGAAGAWRPAVRGGLAEDVHEVVGTVRLVADVQRPPEVSARARLLLHYAVKRIGQPFAVPGQAARQAPRPARIVVPVVADIPGCPR